MISDKKGISSPSEFYDVVNDMFHYFVESLQGNEKFTRPVEEDDMADEGIVPVIVEAGTTTPPENVPVTPDAGNVPTQLA